MHIKFYRPNSSSLNQTNILENIQIRIFIVISVKPVLPSNGTFEVKYEGGNALLKWSTAIGDYTREVIEQWTNNKRQRRAAETECQKNSECTQHNLTKDQTTLTIPVEHQDYIFILVLYDGNIPVNAYRAQEEGTVSG